MVGILAHVSILLINVGQPQSPNCIGYDGRIRGCYLLSKATIINSEFIFLKDTFIVS